jgi:hypothetical protein
LKVRGIPGSDGGQWLEPHAQWLDAGAPDTSVAVERLTRYYVDETGTIWDDRGRKHDGTER